MSAFLARCGSLKITNSIVYDLCYLFIQKEGCEGTHQSPSVCDLALFTLFYVVSLFYLCSIQNADDIIENGGQGQVCVLRLGKMTGIMSSILTTLEANDINRVNRARSHTDGVNPSFWSGTALTGIGLVCLHRICHAKSPTSLFSLFIYIWQRSSATPEYQSNFYGAKLTHIQV